MRWLEVRFSWWKHHLFVNFEFGCKLSLSVLLMGSKLVSVVMVM